MEKSIENASNQFFESTSGENKGKSIMVFGITSMGMDVLEVTCSVI